MLSLFLLLGLQDLTLKLSTDWSDLAKPWMTREERMLYENLKPADRMPFRGYFVARRTENPQEWSAKSLYLPCFYAPAKYGDVRDHILFVLGEPNESKPMSRNETLPGLWSYASYTFHFEAAGSGKVSLAQQSMSDWDKAKTTLIKHPWLRYDFRTPSFGQTRLPEDLSWVDTDMLGWWLTPEGDGATLHIRIKITEEYKNWLREKQVDPNQQMEAIFLLRREGESADYFTLGKKDRIRHGSQRLDLLEQGWMTFETHLPPGHFRVEALTYSGFLERGMRSQASITVLPPELPRLGDPIISQDWFRAGVSMPDEWVLPVGAEFYRASHAYSSEHPARVLVHSQYDDTRLTLQNTPTAPENLKRIGREGGWHIFELPPQSSRFRLVAMGFHSTGDQVALSSFGSAFGKPASSAPDFSQRGAADYLTLETLDIKSAADLTLLFVNDQPLVGSKSGRFAWPSMDWGQTARLDFEYLVGSDWKIGSFELKRNQVFEEIRVKPKFLVAGSRKLDGNQPENVDISVTVDGEPVEIRRKLPFSKIPKLWGLVVNDPILKSQSWPAIRKNVMDWVRKQTGPNDMIYIVHISDRPRLVQAPTHFKPLVLAAVDALEPRVNNNTYFTLRYLIEALTHLKDHQSRAHQVMLLTNQLTDEVEQMQDIIPTLRRTGLQIYNLEFPFEFRSKIEQRTAKFKSPNEEMAIRDQQDIIEGFRTDFQEERYATGGFGFRFGAGKAKKLARDERLRQEAFKASFNEQLAALTAGMSHVTGPGETMQGLSRFLVELEQWQQALVHLELSESDLEEDRLRLITPDGYSAFWTLVEWK